MTAGSTNPLKRERPIMTMRPSFITAAVLTMVMAPPTASLSFAAETEQTKAEKEKIQLRTYALTGS